MASVLPITAPVLPESWSGPSTSAKSISSPSTRTLLPVGPAYLAHLRLTLHNLSFDDHDAHLEAERQRNAGPATNPDDDLGVGDEEETEELLSLDPKEWKKQDHYAVLGLSHLRYKATPEQIKIAHRKKVLKHHPDKKASTTAPSSGATMPSLQAYLADAHTNTNDDAFFKCIQKAHEVLTSPARRAQFDSVDPYYEALDEDHPPPPAGAFKGLSAEAASRKFFAEFGPVFEREARFSRAQPVPQLGAPDAPKEDVHAFYDFWYNFDSWRSFEYLDKEVNEGSDSRDDKRYTEKKNKSERARRKKEDTARLRTLVDVTLSLDPRIKRIKEEEKAAREAKKKTKGPAGAPAKKTKEEEEAEKKAAEEAKKKAEEDEKNARAEAKKAKAAAANAAKKARRQQRAEEGS